MDIMKSRGQKVRALQEDATLLEKFLQEYEDLKFKYDLLYNKASQESYESKQSCQNMKPHPKCDFNCIVLNHLVSENDRIPSKIEYNLQPNHFQAQYEKHILHTIVDAVKQKRESDESEGFDVVVTEVNLEDTTYVKLVCKVLTVNLPAVQDGRVFANELIYFEKKEAIFVKKQNTVVSYGVAIDVQKAPRDPDGTALYSLIKVDLLKRQLSLVNIKVNDKLKFYHVTGLIPAARCYQACSEFGSLIIDQFVKNKCMSWNYGKSKLPCSTVIEMDVDAIRATNGTVLAPPGLYFAMGPPGTGKSQWIANSLLLHVPHNKTTVMVCAPSNIPMMAVAERVFENRRKFPANVRLVCLGRRSLSESLKEAELTRQAARERSEFYAYEYGSALWAPYDKMLAKLENIDFDISMKTTVLRKKLTATVKDLQDLVNEECHKSVSESASLHVKQLIVTLETKCSESQPKDKDEFIERLKMIKKAIMNEETKFQRLLVERANIIFCTLVASGSKTLGKCLGTVNMLIVDESGQATVPETMIPLKYCTPDAIVMHIGDPKQLGPIVYNQPTGMKTGYELSLMDIMEARNPVREGEPRAWCHTFQTQYRMVPDLYHWPNRRYYGGVVKSAPHLEGILEKSPCAGLPPNQFINIQGQEEKVGTSYRNTKEADAIVAKINMLKQQVGEWQICVIAFYAAQVAYIKEQLANHKIEGVNVGTVDGYQGGERDVVLLSVVRTRQEAGFLKESKRINVAMTRAKLLRWVFGDGEKLKISQTDLSNFLATEGVNIT